MTRSQRGENVFSFGVWVTLSVLRDPSLKQLEATLLSSKAAGAIRAYRRTFQTWKCFASSRGEVRPFPGKVELVALYLQHVTH